MKLFASDMQGLTLVETGIALFVLIFGLAAGAELVVLTWRSASLARSQSCVAILAESKMAYLADLYRLNPGDGNLSLGNHGPEDIEVWNRAANRLLNRYRVSWTVAAVPDPRPGGFSGARQLSVMVVPVAAAGSIRFVPWLNNGISLATVLSPRLL